MKKSIRVLASSTVIALVLQTSITGINAKAYDGQVERFAGNDRYETAAKLATSNWGKSDNVVLVSGEGYADALSSSVLAKKLNAPIILTNSSNLNENARKTIEKLEAKNIYVIGGEASISSKIRSKLKNNYKLIELKGKDRFETNLSVAEELVKLGVDPSEVMVVNGKDGFSDALSAAPIAAAKGQILLIVSKDNGNAAEKFIQKYNSRAIVIGTKNVVSDKIYNKLRASKRVDGGANRFETNLKILKEFNVKLDTHLYIANSTGKGYADALVASALAGKFNSPLILTDTKDSKDTEEALKYIKNNIKETTKVNAVGGKVVIPESITEDISKYINKKPDVKPDKSDSKSDKSNSKTDKSDSKTDKSNSKTDKSDSKTDKSDSKSDKSNSKSDKSDSKSDKSNSKTDKSDSKSKNKAPVATGTLNKSIYNIDNGKSEITINLKDLNNDGDQSDIAFKDPDGDKLTYTARIDGENKDKIETIVKGSNIIIKTKEKFKGQVKIIISANDGKESATDFFEVKVNNIDTKKEINTINANLVQKEKARLDLRDLSNIIGDLNLPTNGENGVKISWKSTNINVVNNTGKVVRPKATEGDAIITLTATLSKGEAKDTKNFIITVKAKDFTDEELVDISLKDLNLEGNLNCVIDNIKLPIRDEKLNVDIEWKSTNTNIISNTGVVKRTNKDENVTLTAIVKKGSIKKNKEFKIIVKANEIKTEDNLKLISESLKIDNINNIEKDIKLENSLDGASIVWKSSNQAIVDNTGKVRRPKVGQPDANIVLTATITKAGKSVNKEFNLKVKALKELVANNKEEFYNIIKDSLERFETNVSIKIQNYNDNDYKLDVLNEIVLKHPEINYGYSNVKGQFLGYKGNPEMIMNLTITYRLDKATMEMEKREVKSKVEQIINNVIKKGMSDAEKELALHDYIVKNTDYNIDNYNRGIVLAEDHNAYGVLVKGIGVCESYAKAMYELLNAAGIECKYVTGYSMHNGTKGGGHAWNLVKLDGEWYNLDSTWDDPVSDNNPKNANDNFMPIMHKYFNIPDFIFNQDHIRGEFEQAHPELYPSCTVTKYSFDNMDITEYATDGSQFIKAKNAKELDAAILNAINKKEENLYLKLNGLNMNTQALLDEVKVAIEGKRTSISSYGISTQGQYIKYTFKYFK